MSVMSSKKAGKQPVRAGPSAATQQPVAGSSSTAVADHYDGLDNETEQHYPATTGTTSVPIPSKETHVVFLRLLVKEGWDINDPITKIKAMELQATLMGTTPAAAVTHLITSQGMGTNVDGHTEHFKRAGTVGPSTLGPNNAAATPDQLNTAGVGQDNVPAGITPMDDAATRQRKRDKVAAWMKEHGVRVAGGMSIIGSIVLKILEATGTVSF